MKLISVKSELRKPQWFRVVDRQLRHEVILVIMNHTIIKIRSDEVMFSAFRGLTSSQENPIL